jgi:hypothetical protein
LTVSSDDFTDRAIDYIQPELQQHSYPSHVNDWLNGTTLATPDGDNPFEDTSWLQVLELKAFASFISPNCDGFVAIGAIGSTKGRWDALFDPAGGVAYSATVRYPGAESPAGCGSNSDYTVTWSVTRERVTGAGPHSLRQFLELHHIPLPPGTRALEPTNARISVRGIMS